MNAYIEPAVKILKGIHLFGSQQSKATGYQFWKGFTRADFTDGTTRYMGDVSIDEAVDALKKQGVLTSEFEEMRAGFEREHSYPPKPEATEFYHNYGYEKPVEFHKWAWSTTFGQWSALVTFADGWHGYTYPKTP